MSQVWKTVRVFISSTFKDMQAERDHLVRFVFPRLREELLKRRIHLVDVDLRWGVMSDQDAFDLCMDEINRCHPRFICLLGGRYGWVPPPRAVPRDLLDRIISGTSAAGALSGEERSALADLYLPDAATGVCNLRAKPRTKAELRDFYGLAETAVGVFLRAGLPDVRQSITASEVHYGALDRLHEPTFRYFYFRNPAATNSIPLPWASDYREPHGSPAERLLDELKACIQDPKTRGKVLVEPRQAVEAPLPWYEYPCRWDERTERIIDLKAFGDRVYADLLASVDAEFGTQPAEKLDEFAEENAAMEAFIEERTERYVLGTRQPIFDQLRRHVEGTGGNNRYLCLVGEPGSGKSALLAQFVKVLSHPGVGCQVSGVSRREPDASAGDRTSSDSPSTLHPPPSTLVISHFVGASPGSTDVRRTLRRFCHELAVGTGITDEIPEDFEKLRQAFPSFLHKAAVSHHIVILIDAINQFDASYQSSGMYWLPNDLPTNARIILSALPGPALEALGKRSQPPVEIPLPALAQSDAQAIIDAFLARYRKALEPDQRHALLGKTEASTPLYLLAALEELRTLGTRQEIAERIRDLPGETHPLFIWILKRLESDPEFRDLTGNQIGAELVSKFVSYIGVSRYGLSYTELADLLAPGDPKNDPPIPADDQGNVAALVRLLRPYLMQRGELLDFYHGQLREAGREQYGLLAHAATAHREMADYFTACAKGTDPRSEWETDSVRGFAECVFHLTKAGQHEQASGLLSNLPFLMHKLRVGLLDGVLEDYDLVQREAASEVVRRLDIWQTFFREKAHILRRGKESWPAYKILLQLAIEHADDSPLTVRAEEWLGEKRCDWFWLRRVQRLPHAQRNPCLAVLEGHSGEVGGALELADRRLLSWAADGTLRFWDGRTGACLAVLKGHTTSVAGALVLGDGRVLSWSNDGTLRLWDGHTGACLAVLEGHRTSVTGALVLGDGRVLSWSNDGTLRLWGSQTGECLATIDGHAEWPVNGAQELANGHLLSRSADATMRVWDGRSGACLAILEGHGNWIEGTLALADGRLVSWSRDKTLRVWDRHSGACLAILEGHGDWVDGAIPLAGGRLLSWSHDGTLRLWDAQSGECLTVLEGHTAWVNGALALEDGRLLSWSNDCTLRLWDGQSGSCLSVLEGHTGVVLGALQLSDGRLLSWSGDGSLRSWDARSGSCLTTIEAHPDYVGGVLELTGGRLLSWPTMYTWKDRVMRVWDSSSGNYVQPVEGHKGSAIGVLTLSDGRFLSWSEDKTLRIWENDSGNCMAVLRGHTAYVAGAAELSDGRLLSWADWSDFALRLWDGRNGAFQRTLEGHEAPVLGVLELTDGRLLSFSRDGTLRLWNSQSGVCLATLKGHADEVLSAVELSDGRWLSCSKDCTLRVWNRDSGVCVAILEGHKDSVNATQLADGRILSWSYDGTLRLWDSQGGKCLEVVEEGQVDQLHPEWVVARAGILWSTILVGDFCIVSSSRTACLLHGAMPATLNAWFQVSMASPLATWCADSDGHAHYLLPDGSVVVTQANGQVCILKLHHGNRRISLADAEALLSHRGMLKG